MLGPRLFRLCSRIFREVYPRVPVLGELRSSIAIIERDGRYLMQERSDGLGWAFPGGVAWFWESPEQTLRREVREETGLHLTAVQFVFLYHDRTFIPSRISVYRSQAQGEPRGSWEGGLSWRPRGELAEGLFPAQRAVVEFLASAASVH